MDKMEVGFVNSPLTPKLSFLFICRYMFLKMVSFVLRPFIDSLLVRSDWQRYFKSRLIRDLPESTRFALCAKWYMEQSTSAFCKLLMYSRVLRLVKSHGLLWVFQIWIACFITLNAFSRSAKTPHAFLS